MLQSRLKMALICLPPVLVYKQNIDSFIIYNDTVWPHVTTGGAKNATQHNTA